jgi:hypothetical protein
MNQYIANESTTFNSPRSRRKVSLTIIGGETVSVQCLILHDHDESAVVILNDWGPLISQLHSVHLVDLSSLPQRRVGPILDGQYLAVEYSPALGNWKSTVTIYMTSVSGNSICKVFLLLPDVGRLIQLLKGPTT